MFSLTDEEAFPEESSRIGKIDYVLAICDECPTVFLVYDITILMMIAQTTLLAVMLNYTGANFSSMYNVKRETNDEMEEYISYTTRYEMYISAVLFLIMVIGFTGNGVLVFTILRHANIRNIPNTYILSLALGDLLMIVIAFPFTVILHILKYWSFGFLLCQLSKCVQDIFVGVSIFTLTALSADRYFAIVDPMRRLRVTGKRSTVIVAVMIWILAIVCAILFAFSNILVSVDRNVLIGVCYSFLEEFGPNYPKVILICRFFIYYMIPLGIIAVFYMLAARHLMHRTKNMPSEMQMMEVLVYGKVGKIVTTLVNVFAICFFPQHIFKLWFIFNPTSLQNYNNFWHYFNILAFCLSFINSCLNPIALYCVSGTFRKYFDKYLLCRADRRI